MLLLFFDHIHAMHSDSPLQVRSVLAKLLRQTDAITVGIAKSDHAAVSFVQQILDELHARKNQ
jgi:hypothetical protein